jgi:putative transposase
LEDQEVAGKLDKPEEIVLKLRQVEVLQGQGMKIADAVRQIGITQQTYYRYLSEQNTPQATKLKNDIFPENFSFYCGSLTCR